MQAKRFLLPLFFIGAFLLGACNLPGSVLQSTPTVVATQPPVIPTNTVAPTAVVFPSVTPTFEVLPTPTLTLFYEPTITSTPDWLSCPLVITRNNTSAGDTLHIRRCEDNLEYDLGPFAKGIYTVGPNQKFIVYITDNGFVYAAKIGNPTLILVANLVREQKFKAINKRVLPEFVISFWGEAPHYKLVLVEQKFAQRRSYVLPVGIQE